MADISSALRSTIPISLFNRGMALYSRLYL